jgi:peptidyl-prolyl cis-trans isomerase SurA
MLRGIVMGAVLLGGPSCQSRQKPPMFKPPLPGQTLQVPGQPVAPTPPKTTRSQKPESPPVVTLPPATLADGEVVVKVVAYVNNVPIFESELREKLIPRLRELENLSESERERKLKQLREEELEKLIEREVVLAVAFARLKQMPAKILEDLQKEATREYERRIKQMREEYKLKSEEQLNEFFAQMGMTVAGFRRSMEREFIAVEFMRNLIFPKLQHIPLSEIRTYFDTHPDEFTIQDRVKWLDIFIDASRFPNRAAARQFAEQTLASLRGGADFAQTAVELQKAGYNPLLGPEGVGEKPGEIRPAELQTAVFALDAGQLGGPVEVPGGYHLIQVVERTRAGRKPFNAEVQNEIRNKLMGALANKEYKRLVDDMKSRALIQRLE